LICRPEPPFLGGEGSALSVGRRFVSSQFQIA
jgi:hypothetical protein